MQTQNKNLTQSKSLFARGLMVLALALTWTLTGAASAVVFVLDNFNANTGNTYDLNVDIARQTGTLAPITYSMAGGSGNYGHQLQNGNAQNQLLLADFPQSTSSLNYNFNGVLAQGGLKISFDLDSMPTVYGGTPDNWGCINLGMSQASQLANVNGAEPHFGILFRAAGTIQAFDGGSVVSPSPEPVYTSNPPGTMNHIDLLIFDTDGNPFDGAGGTTIEVYANGGATPVYSFTKAGGGYTDNYINLQGCWRSHFDNLEVASRPEAPLPTIANPSFEADTFTVWPGYVNGNGPITGWTSAGGAGINPAGGSAPFADNGTVPDGTQVAFIQEDSALSQMINGFQVGRSYQIRYFENARNCCGGTVPYLEVRIGGQTLVAAHWVSPVGGSNPYHEVITDPFMASATSLELAFVKSNPSGGDTTVVIDNVGFLASGTPPSIIQQPQSLTAGIGETVTFTVGAVGSAPLQYQWFFNENPIPGATAGSLSFQVQSADQAGNYRVTVSNSTGSVDSQNATLTVRALVPGLFNTGVDDNGNALADSAVDPHYTLVVNADSASTDAIVEDSTVFPIVTGPWVANTARSKWIGPRFNTAEAAALAVGNGTYVYRIDFDLTGIDRNTLVITGGWAIDNAGLAIRVNGVDTGLVNNNGFGGLTPFTIDSSNASFLDGLNTLDFVVQNTDPVTGYTGLRVANLHGLAVLPGTPPSIVQQPQGQSTGTGLTVTFTVRAEGSSPLSYQWKKDGQAVPGATGAALTLSNLTRQDAGVYTVVVSNPAGSATSDPAELVVRDTVPGLFNTGMDDAGAALADGSIDLHYKIILNPDSTSPDALVQDSTVFPIVDGTWLRNTATSKWIGPRFETSAATGGDYEYLLVFDLTGFDPASVRITGGWATDNDGLEIFINDLPTGNANPAQFAALTPFAIESGFQAGLNKLVFRVNNASAGYTGLKVDNLLALGDALPPGTAPFIVQQPRSVARVVTQTASFSVGANGSQPISYQWFFGPDPLPGETGPTLSFLIEFPDQAGQYSVEVSNPFGSVRSDPAILSVSEVPLITRQPQSLFVAGGDLVTFSVEAIGGEPLNYQWLFNGTDMPGATDPTFSIPGVFPEDAGVFQVRVSNYAGSVLSDEAVLTVASAIPGVYNTGVDDASAALADGSIDSHYKISLNADSASPDALVENSSVFPISDGTWLPNNANSKWIGPRFETSAAAGGDYAYRLTFDLTDYDTALVQLTGDWSTDNAGLDILINGQSTGASSGSFKVLTPFAIRSGFLPGLNTVEFRLNNASVGYTGLKVDNIRGLAVPLPPGTAPFILTQPEGITVQPGTTVTLRVVANGSAPLAYQWFFGSDPIPGETGSVLSFLADFPDLSGDYSVEVSNPFGSVRSNPALVRVGMPNEPPSFVKGPDLVVPEDAGPITVPGWATQISPGPADESSQSVMFTVSTDNVALFAALPALSPDGTLTFQSAPNAFGQANVEVVLKDSGGTENGGIDTSEPQSFVITVTPVNDPPACSGVSLTVCEDQAADIILAGSDVDGDALSGWIVDPPANGTVTVTGNVATYQGNLNYSGPDSFTFKVTDQAGAESGVCSVSVTVMAGNDSPVGVIEVRPTVDLGPTVPGVNVVSPNNVGACVILDATQSSDVDNNFSDLSFTWIVNGMVVGSGPVLADVCLLVGENEVKLVVNDGTSGTGACDKPAESETVQVVTVLTGMDAAEELINQIYDTMIERKNKQPFIASLKNAAAAFERGSFGAGLNMLEALIHKFQAQLKANPDVQAQWIKEVRSIIDGMSAPVNCEGCAETP
jgi:hypothetical protein